MFPSLCRIFGLIAWGGALYGVLRISDLPGNWGHSVCGPWGCGPRTQVLVAWHGFWVVLLAPLVAWGIRRASARALRRVGLALVLVGGTGLITVLIWESLTWLPQVSAWQRAYFIQRCLFTIVTLVEVPVIPLALSGVILWSAAKARQRRRRAAGSGFGSRG